MAPPNAPNPTDPLSTASHLTHRELLCRRLHNIKRLTKHYRRIYWDLMDQVKIKHRQYVLETGLSPFEEPDVVVDNYTNICSFDGCNSKTMPLTPFCFPHILSDPKQQLYKPCTFVVSRSATGAVTCKKPIDRWTTPSYCTVHMKKVEMHLTMTLKKMGMNISLVGKVGPNKLHHLVRLIQAKRRAMMRAKEGKTVLKKEDDGSKKEEDSEECKTMVKKEDDVAED